MRSSIERELKLDPPPGFVLPSFPGEELESRVFTSTYYDTPQRSLAHAGITLRRRLENGLSLWQLKLPRDGAARAELEVAGGPAGPPEELCGLLVAHLRHGAVEPVATLRTRRRGRRVADGPRPIADVTLDAVDVLAGSRSIGPFEELEVELLEGGEDELDRLGRVLRRAGAKRSAGVSKLMRVLELRPAARPVDDASAAGATRHILALQLRRLEQYDPGVRLGEEAEDLHRFRVATRRSRAIAQATRPLLGDALEPLLPELKWLAGMLGPVRDLDVLLGRLRASAAGLDADREAASRIVARLEEARESARRALLAALDSERYLRLLDLFGSLVDALEVSERGPGLRTLAAKDLKRLRKAARLAGPAISDGELHALRVRAKRARYTAELVSEPLSKRYVDSLKAVQDTIGKHQDAVVAEQHIRGAAGVEEGIAAGRLVERERARASAARAAYGAELARAVRAGRRALG